MNICSTWLPSPWPLGQAVCQNHQYTCSRAASVATEDVKRPNKGVRDTTANEVPAEGGTSSRFKRKRANVVAPGMLCYSITCLILF